MSNSKNSLSLLEHAFDNGREAGINCVMQAVVLVEACLSVRLQARTVALHPLSPYDMDQHYVTVVWTGPSSQWAMLDPSFGTSFRDPDGTILSPWQLRRRFAEEAEVSCEAPTDFGDDPKLATAEYREYIAKSIFYLHRRSSVSRRQSGNGSGSRPDRRPPRQRRPKNHFKRIGVPAPSFRIHCATLPATRGRYRSRWIAERPWDRCGSTSRATYPSWSHRHRLCRRYRG